jgi:hypothetical protein
VPYNYYNTSILINLHVLLFSDNTHNIKKIQNLAEIQGVHYAPIDLNLHDAEEIQLPPLKWVNYNIAPEKMKITNTAFTGKLINIS